MTNDYLMSYPDKTITKYHIWEGSKGEVQIEFVDIAIKMTVRLEKEVAEDLLNRLTKSLESMNKILQSEETY